MVISICVNIDHSPHPSDLRLLDGHHHGQGNQGDQQQKRPEPEPKPFEAIVSYHRDRSP
jgi:hypothetical protein